MRKLVIALVCFASAAQAGDPELLPLHPPQSISPPTALPLDGASFMRRSYLDRWNYYAVDQQGYFRPRVVLAPQPYYLVNGRPFPLMSVEPSTYIPYLFD